MLATIVSLLQASADYEIFHVWLPEAWALIAGYASIMVINVGVWIWAYRLFDKESVSYRPIFGLCGAAFIPVAVAAFFVDQQYNAVNRHHLDQRHAVAYRAENPDAIKQEARPMIASIERPSSVSAEHNDGRHEGPHGVRAVRPPPYHRKHLERKAETNRR